MAEPLLLLPEPELEFRYGQRAVDPRIGLSLFGPYDADFPSHIRSIPYGLIGTDEGARRFLGFARSLQGPIVSSTESDSPTLWPAFPGFDAAFVCNLPASPARSEELDSTAITEAVRHEDPNQRAYTVVDLYLAAIVRLLAKEEQLSVIICIVPEVVYKNCRPKSYVKTGVGEALPSRQRDARARGIRDILNPEKPSTVYRFSPDFRRQIKARAMRYEPPIQIIRESTLRLSDERQFGERLLSPFSDRAWNLGTAIYYKGGGRPWRLATAREGVCYVGVVFHRAVGVKDNTYAACAAQMFLDDGDGVVLRGETGPWYSPSTGQFHLSRAAASSLLTKVLETYAVGGGNPLREIFLHYRAEINTEEFHGFLSVCPSNAKLVAVKVRTQREDIRLFREGTRPVMRGTFLPISERSSYLFASGFKPWLRTYDGVEIPAPLEIRVQHGDARVSQVAGDIFGLTKLNYNECRLGDSQPVTIGFSEAVGEILVSNPGVKEVRPRFKYYI